MTHAACGIVPPGAAAPPSIVKPQALSCEDGGLVMIRALLILF